MPKLDSNSSQLLSSIPVASQPQIDYASILRLFRDELTESLVDRQVAALKWKKMDPYQLEPR
jgi:hypothetical protein